MASKKLVLDLLEQEVEDFIQTQAEKVIEFEDDPMAYILNKYPSLKDTLTDLMTKHFGDYVTGIYVMAPKPTTFKVLLHNGQFYYLTYAKDSYIAKIQGKKYYLLDLGAEEYAIKAIADLLTMGKPPGAKGPDDQEDNVTITDTETTTDVDITDDGGGDDDLSEAKEKNPETDDYGRPFVDPKGSRTYMDPDEMTPAARARKMMGEKNEEEFKPHMMYDPKTGEGKYAKVKDDHLKLKAKGWGHDKPKRVANEKKIRIVKESVEKKKSPLKFKILKEKSLAWNDISSESRKLYRLSIIADKVSSKDPFTLEDGNQEILTFVDPTYADLFANQKVDDIRNVGGKSINNFKFFKDSKGNLISFKEITKTKDLGGTGGNKAQTSERQERGLIDAINSIKGVKNLIGANGYKIPNIERAEKQPDPPRAEAYADLRLIRKGNKPYLLSAKGIATPSIAGGGLGGVTQISSDLGQFVKEFYEDAYNYYKKIFNDNPNITYDTNLYLTPTFKDVNREVPTNLIDDMLRGNEAMGGPVDGYYIGPMEVEYKTEGNNIITNGEVIPLDEFAKKYENIFMHIKKRSGDYYFTDALQTVNGITMPLIFTNKPGGKMAKSRLGSNPKPRGKIII